MVAVTSLLLTLSGHAAAGGGLPDLAGLAVVAAVSVAVAVAVARRPIRASAVAPLLLAGQAVSHVVLSVGVHHSAGSGPPVAMALWHLCAAVGAAAVLAHADRLIERWLTMWSTVLGAPWTTHRPLGSFRARPADPSDVTPTLQALRFLVTRRGPPRPVLHS